MHNDTNTPPIQKTMLFGLATLVIFIGGFLLWALLAPIDSAAIAPGKIIVAGKTRVVQHLEGGIVQKILVRDGSKVTKGQTLIKVDDTRSAIALQIIRNEVFELLAIETRLKAERDHAKKLHFPQRLKNAEAIKTSRNIMAAQQRIFKANAKNLNDQVNILQQRIKQLKEQMVGVKGQIVSHVRQLKLLREELKAVVYLQKRKLIDKPRLLKLQRNEAYLIGKQGENKSKLATLKQRIGETKLQIITLHSKQRKEILTQLRDTQQKLTELLQKEKAAQDTLTRTDVVSPQDGIVVNLKIHTKGAVIQPGEMLMEIVPTKEHLIAQVRVNPLDIDVVHPGLKAQVRLTVLKMRTTPTLSGIVTHVSADALTDKTTQNSYYEANVAISKQQLKRLHGQKLYPGMPVEVMIITDNITPWNYLMAPIKNSMSRAFREA